MNKFASANKVVAKAYFHSNGAKAINAFPNNSSIVNSGKSAEKATIDPATKDIAIK